MTSNVAQHEMKLKSFVDYFSSATTV